MLSSLDIVLLIGSIASIVMFGYVAYWAFAIRRALAVRLYRNQALGIGLIAVITVLVLLFFPLVIAYNLQLFLGGKSSPLILGWFLSQIAFQLVAFYFIDASILAARRSDPLLRDTFAWRRLRKSFWPLLLGLIAVSYLLIGPSHPGLGLSPVLVLLVSGTIVLPISAYRSRDSSLRKNLMWFAFFAAAFFISLLLPVITSVILQIVSGSFLFFVPMAYFLYRSARSLVPLNRIEAESNSI